MSNQLAQELATNLRASKTQLNTVNQQLAHLERQEQLAKVTTQELESYPADRVWRGCGKAFVLQDKSKYIDDLSHDVGVVKEQTKALRIKKNYLETTIDKIVQNLKAMMGNH
ncbi:PFD1 (YJL179W) [Zygosaccharomyces parabailii]|uniref:BN860_01354g1_1 n=1 Tax=Zygosaccharomyces bailii (strain CLIB 213 / ATCC 58445 / CBS 680 / BCRC 21525 / NBRC 1098 / NCYC 1416 / NRRL Y-2227) TaxID=1333698 RepID=A0A8J2T4T1_ZYGB2|nr:PFD1 (YJL179W) [Zygosaccharomyces parabailii]CDF88059.1 BN860_01354g1_1 [Zygosaccharomyces bailii CLIB 213]CDH09111.1 probable Prefoldin subunit 1 [Zygosaccharomyces bailii ISA1307]SJM87367.1 probable Prefoldin subunit 1 [Zygosaccharomyces bailii]